MGRTKKPGRRGEYRVFLDHETVCRLRERAARESLKANRVVSWHDLLRAAANLATNTSMETK